MSGDEVRKVSQHDIQLVRNLIGHCLQLYMNQKEVVDTLLYQAKIEPSVTQSVWKKLEVENREFFKAYHLRLLLKNQIHVFNKLLRMQVELMQKIPLSNPSTSSTLQQAPQYYLSRPSNNIYCNGGSNGVTSANQSSQNVLLTHNTQMERSDDGINGISIKSEANSSSSDFAFGADNNNDSNSFLDMQTPLEAEPHLGIESSSFRFPSQMARNLSFSDLTNDFVHRDDILENYGTLSPFLGHEMNSFLDSSGRDCGEEDERLYTISEWPSLDVDFRRD